MQTPQILIVEDEQVTRNTLKSIFEAEGYTVFEASDGEEMHQLLSENQVNLVIMDINLPGKNGLLLARELREQANVALMFLTGRDNEVDKILGLEIGADDYITKPFGLRELLARIRAVLRRTQSVDNKATESNAQIGKLKVDFSSFEGFVDGEEVKMSSKEVEILHFLWDKKNQTVSRDDLLDKVWGTEYQPTSRTIDNFVLKLRQKIEDDPNHAKIILTVHGVGYRLVY